MEWPHLTWEVPELRKGLQGCKICHTFKRKAYVSYQGQREEGEGCPRGKHEFSVSYQHVLAAWSSVFTSFLFSWRETKMRYIWQGRGCGTQLPGGGLELWEQHHLQEVWILLCSGDFTCIVHTHFLSILMAIFLFSIQNWQKSLLPLELVKKQNNFIDKSSRADRLNLS